MFVNYRTYNSFPAEDRYTIDLFAAIAAEAIHNHRMAEARSVREREKAWRDLSAFAAHKMETQVASISAALEALEKSQERFSTPRIIVARR
jgi:hypothetical protein